LAEALIICRFLHFSAAMLLFGASTFTGLLAPAGLRTALEKSLRFSASIMVIVIAVTAILWLGLEAGEIGDGWSDAISTDIVSSVLSDTAFGQVWVWRLVLAAALIGALFLKKSLRRNALLVLSTLVLASLLSLVMPRCRRGLSVGCIVSIKRCICCRAASGSAAWYLC
jgi:putative copper resistance protein D